MARKHRTVLQAADLFRLLADPARLRVLLRLRHGESTGAELAHAAGLARQAITYHLGRLRAAGLVLARREGRSFSYRVGSPLAADLLRHVRG